jgi:hypothetical protein
MGGPEEFYMLSNDFSDIVKMFSMLSGAAHMKM